MCGKDFTVCYPYYISAVCEEIYLAKPVTS